MQGRDLKAEIARAGLHSYRVAAECGINPTRLSKILNDRAPLTDRDRNRILEALGRLAGARA